VTVDRVALVSTFIVLVGYETLRSEVSLLLRWVFMFARSAVGGGSVEP
jgi:hypothetical protein